jgi:hypothetical protein
MPNTKRITENANREKEQAMIERWNEETGEFEDESDGPEPGEECGRWNNGRLMQTCMKAGSEECDWECPYSR